jgi:murein DD-endopeptidase MepM/ murein hydrolase activator NlpD
VVEMPRGQPASVPDTIEAAWREAMALNRRLQAHNDPLSGVQPRPSGADSGLSGLLRRADVPMKDWLRLRAREVEGALDGLFGRPTAPPPRVVPLSSPAERTAGVAQPSPARAIGGQTAMAGAAGSSPQNAAPAARAKPKDDGSVVLQSPVRGEYTLNPRRPAERIAGGEFGAPRGDASKPRSHKGHDVPAAVGTPIYPAANGRVVYAGPKGTYGQTVEIDHGNGLMTRYAHLDEVQIKVGSEVTPEQSIGTSGTTGNAKGTRAPHLHWEVQEGGVARDPYEYLPPAVRPQK